MEEPTEAANVVPELYFLIAKFLSGGPLRETAKTLLKELESVEVLPRRLDWEGNEHAQSYDELDAQYSEVPWRRLAAVCERALQLASAEHCSAGPVNSTSGGNTCTNNGNSSEQQKQNLRARLSLLSESLVRPKPKYSLYKQDHSLVRRLAWRELGGVCGAVGGGAGVRRVFPARLLGGLQLQRRTLGHLSAVYCLVFDRTGRYVVTGADDLLVKVWSAVDGRLLSTLRGAGAEITDVCVSGDGALLAAGSVERLVRVWCLASGAPRAVLHAHAGTITSVHWAPPAATDVRWLASTSTDGSVAFWTCAADGQFLSRPVQYVERMRPGACHMICAAWSAGGAFLAAGSADHHVRVYAVDGAGPRRVLETAVHGDAVDSIAWAHRGLRLVSGSKDGSAALWTLHATQWRHVLLRAETKDDTKKLKVTMVCWDCSDAYVMTAVSDNTVRVWCARTCTQVRVLAGHKDEAYVLEAHPFLPAVLLSAGHDGQLFVWDAAAGEVLAHFHNRIEGQGEGALFDAKWGGGATVAASDSHGHVLLLGLGQGHRLLRQLPTELFFHTDYRPLVRDALGGALDEQTETPPHLMPPPFLVDVEGAPHAPQLQRLVPGRENLALSQLIPAAEAARSRLDVMIAELAGGGGGGGSAPAGPWRGEGVRHTAGSWQRGDPLLVPHSTRPVVQPLCPAARERVEQASAELNALEMAWYRREMRRRPLMISTAAEGAPVGPARRRAGRRPRASAPRPAPRPTPRPAPALRVEVEPADVSSSDTSDETVRLSPSAPSAPSSRSSRTSASSRSSASSACSRRASTDHSDSESSASSQYSDWQAGPALAPPARARRRPLPAKRYSPSTGGVAKRVAGGAGGTGAPRELPEAYRPGEWLTAVTPRKAPYHPQMGDHCVYFRLGHQRYFEAVAEKDLYKINPRDKPWERMHIYECEAVKVVGMKYVIKPPRVVCMRLARAADPRRRFVVRYHDMPDVIDFLVLRAHYDAAAARRWGAGDRFRCMIDDSWWTGMVLERMGPAGVSGAEGEGAEVADDAQRWATEAASHFLSLRVRWDNGEVERLSPWDLEPLDPERLPEEPGGAVPVLPQELEAALRRADTHEWPPGACRAIALHIGQVMSLSVAEPFVAPVDLQRYPSYALVVPYPVDLATIRARFDNLFYRRAAAAQFDARCVASNAERFNEPHSPIVRQARLVTDLLLHIISEWRSVDVVAKYHELAAAYHSSDDEPLADKRSGSRASRAWRRAGRGEAGGPWRAACESLLAELMASADAEPFRRPVSPHQAPDYGCVVATPMDLGTVRARLEAGAYARPAHFAADVRLVFANSRLYNTNKRSRIYSMTVRLSSLFEALWSSAPQGADRSAPAALPQRSRSARRTRRATRRSRRAARAARDVRRGGGGGEGGGVGGGGGASGSSESEPLAATSRRVHAARDDSWDSDAPLDAHRKGKGVGKKSKRSSVEPTPSTSYALRNSSQGTTPDSSPPQGTSQPGQQDPGGALSLRNNEKVRPRRKRPRAHSSGSAPDAPRPHHVRHKRTRERFASASCTTSDSGSEGSAGAGARAGAGRYESDRSYRPRYSTDDDAPLLLYRERQRQGGAGAGAGASGGAGGGAAGPSRRAHGAHPRVGGGVSLRTRSPRRYNEDSEEDSVAAISKRLPHHHRHTAQQHQLARRRERHAAQVVVGAHTTDHNYFNGHAATHDAHETHNGHASGAGGGGGGGSGTSGGPVSISSRGRVRKLTAKARGLLRH